LYDWSMWIQANDDNARAMASTLMALSPGHDPGEEIVPGSPVRVSVEDARGIPSIVTDYAGQVPINHASASLRRMIALAYMLTWTWSEHRVASELRGDELSGQMVMLFDEVESHLHPRWQRSILKALRDIGAVFGTGVDLQLVVSTHSPLVLASAESWFDPDCDAWFDLDVVGEPRRAQIQRRNYTPHGTAGSWLMSEAFDLATDRSLEAERAVLRAREIVRQTGPEPPTLQEEMAVHDQLREALPDIDRFWVRWNAFVERMGRTP
ncbi:MAG: AAA family ATPase, partial [Rhodospirillaceae bacterium]|nr:AAA family ATPase [Rhodospirillaceae bacterium]